MQKIVAAILVFLLFSSATCENSISDEQEYTYRERMVNFVDTLSTYAKKKESDFIVIPQNGIQLLTKTNSESTGLEPNQQYLNAIDGIGRESVFYGYNADNEATPQEARSYINRYLQLARTYGKTVMVTDYAHDPEKMEASYEINDSNGYISFAANHRELDAIPPYPDQPHEVNDRDIHQLSQAENFLYLLNTQNYSSKSEYIQELDATNYDLIIMDLFFHANTSLTPEDVDRLKTKANGGRRLVIAYMSIGEAEDYRYYWNRVWSKYPPSWLEQENPNWEGNYLVRYWNPEWQDIIYGSEGAYLDRILAAGFDGMYLDLVDAYRNFEDAQNED